MTKVIAGLAIAGVFLFSVVVTYISVSNQENRLRNLFNNQQRLNHASFDKMWKIIQQQTGVSNSERESFRKTYVDIMTATKGVAGNGQLASFFTQAKVDVNSNLFEKLMNSIESQRESFFRDQQRLLDIKNQHDDLVTTFPGSLICGGRERLEAKIVTSTKTEETFDSGLEDIDTAEKL